MHDHAGSNLYAIAPEHTAGLVALLILPVALWLLFRLVGAAAAAHVPIAVRLRDGYNAAPTVTRAAALLLLVTGTIHLGLGFGHAAHAPGMALLFLVNGMLFLGAAVLAFSWRRWRALSTVLLITTLLAYLVMLAGQRESPDQLGIATKLVELTALGLVLLPAAGLPSRRRRWIGASTTVVALTVLTGAVTWITAFIVPADAAAHAHQPDAVAHEHRVKVLPGTVMGNVPAGPPTAEQQEAAARLLAETGAGTERFRDLAVARAEGYRPDGLGGDTTHWLSSRNEKDGRTLDPLRPEGLVYANAASGPVLLGAVYQMPVGESGPVVGGSLTAWHKHQNICFSALSRTLSGIASPFGRCPAGSVMLDTPEMIHVWVVPQPGGSFGDLDEQWVKEFNTQ
jgi:hypothetical protein